jgi:hypothetical protein
VRENLESQRRQYGFAEQAVALGWGEQQPVIVDEDQARSGAIPWARSGFARLVGAVARAEVGIVMSLEPARLSRNDPDWHHLVHLCRWTTTLIAYDVDEAGEVSISSDETVADAIRLVFGKLDELGTARQVFVWWQQEGRPRGPFAAARTGAVTAGGAWWWAIGARRLAGRERAQELLIADVGSILQ